MLHTLSDELLLSQVKTLAGEERKIHRQVLEYLFEVDRRQLHLTRGYPSLFAFCTEDLGYSPASAQRRIASMRLLKEMSSDEREQVQAKIEAGRLSLNHLAGIQSVARTEKFDLDTKRDLLKRMEGTSVRECERILVSQMSAPTLPRESVRPVSATQSQVTLVLDDETLKLLERFKELTAHRNPMATNGEAIRLALQIAVERVDPAREAALRQGPPPRTRQASLPLKRQIWRRDGCCQYVDPFTGRRCMSRFKLELDHRVPFSRGGETSAENLMLLCRAHNGYFGNRIKEGG